MRYQHQRSGEIDQAFFQDFQRRNVEVVGRFVEQKNVSRLKHKLRDQHARPFASGKTSDRLAELLARKQESCGPSSDVNDTIAIDNGIAVGRERASQSHIGIERASLVEVNDAQPISAANLASSRSKVAL